MTSTNLTRVVAVVPTYDEASTIERTIADLIALPCQLDVIVADARSPDRTTLLVRGTHAHRNGRVIVLDGPSNQGIGRANHSGIGTALRLGYDTIVQLDADRSHHCGEITSLLEGLRHTDLAIGSRYVPGGRAPGLSPARRVLSIAGNGYARSLLRLEVRDLTSGFKAWSHSALQAAQPRSSVTDGYVFHIEMTLRASRAGALVCEVPIQFDLDGSVRRRWAGGSPLRRFAPCP
jgi:dolichol-phosphate mannosyltransferase